MASLALLEPQPRVIGRYALYDEIAAGGMATVHYGRLHGAAGFSRTVAIKRLHPNFARDPEFVAMFLTEARLAARIRHPNVVQTLDVIATEGEMFLVLEYVLGESLATLRRAMIDAGRPADPRIVATIMGSVLRGLHAAHEAKREDGQPLDIVHRDVSPQNILVGADGIARVIDFGVAKAVGKAQTTREGQLKGKLAYMPPEQLRGQLVTRQCDVYAAAVVTWELLTRERLFRGDHEGSVVTSVLTQTVTRPSVLAPQVPAAFDRVIMCGLERDPANRYATAKDMAVDLERCVGIVSASEIGEWVESLVGPQLSRRVAQIARIEGVSPECVRLSDRAEPPVGVPITVEAKVETRVETRVEPRALLAEPDLHLDVSHVAITSVAGAPSKKRNRFIVAAVLGGAAIACALCLSWMHGRSTSATATSAAQLPTAASESRTQPSSPAPSAPQAPSAPDMSGWVTILPVVSDAGVQAPRPAPAPARAVTPRPRATRGECNTPFTMDDKGHKHYKAACL